MRLELEKTCVCNEVWKILTVSSLVFTDLDALVMFKYQKPTKMDEREKVALIASGCLWTLAAV